VRVAITHGTDKEYTGLVKLENKVLADRKSGWRNYGWPGNSPLENCSELPMKVVSIICALIISSLARAPMLRIYLITNGLSCCATT